jgi:molecular chaperone GrpE (heat shock protein)
MCQSKSQTEIASEDAAPEATSDQIVESEQDKDSDVIEKPPETGEGTDLSTSVALNPDLIGEEQPVAPQEGALAEVNQTLSVLQKLFEKQIARNQSQTQMFDAVYREMKDYKESFLLEALHKPIIKDLVMLYDSVARLESQLNELINGKESLQIDDLSPFQTNLENVRFELEEVLYRVDVTPYEERLEVLDRKLHRTLSVKSTDDPNQEGKVAEVHKIGFYWRGKVFRPEEVTIFRYTPPTPEKGDETDE